MQDAITNICELLSARKATLFLGAGMNAGIKNGDQQEFPLGSDLAQLIARDLLNDELLKLTLDEASELARHAVGEQELNRYLYDLFDSYAPGEAHLAAVQLPWDTIYTTNFDLLLEKAETTEGIVPAGRIRPVVSFSTDLSQFGEEDILYYKLHGSIDLANTVDGRLTLTKEDYRYYQRQRRLLFGRLRDALATRTFVFVGYSMFDANFREILEDCREELGCTSLPRSYAVRPKFRPAEADFWMDKYNIQLLDVDGCCFMTSLRDTWIKGDQSVLTPEERLERDGMMLPDGTVFPKHGDCYYIVTPTACRGSAQANLFFKGAEPTWCDIRDSVPAERDITWRIYEELFDELDDPNSGPSACLVTGHAGTGKTTVMRTLAFSLSKDLSLPVLVHIPGTPLEVNSLRLFFDEHRLRRIVLLIHDAAEVYEDLVLLYSELQRHEMPVTVLLEERLNQWMHVEKPDKHTFAPTQFCLKDVSSTEVDRILDALSDHHALGRLAGLDRPTQHEHFERVADKDLLVALRELTTETSFDEIIKDEYSRIPSALAKDAYGYAAALGQVDLHIRYATLLRLLNCGAQELSTSILKPTEGVLLTTDQTGHSRHTIGFRVRVRHPVVASIVFSEAAPTDEDKLKILNSILAHLDPGFREDAYLLRSIVQRRHLVETLASVDSQRQIYDRLAQLMPQDAYVAQHRSILERQHGAADEAVAFAREARRLAPHNPAIGNTLGLALENAARSETAALRREALLSEALSLFKAGSVAGRNDPYGYLGQVYIMRQRLNEETLQARKDLLDAEMLALLDNARAETDGSPIIEREFAQELARHGDTGGATQVLGNALDAQPSNERIRTLLIDLLVQQSEYDEALDTAVKGLTFAPNSWRLNRAIGRLKARSNESVNVVVDFYEAAIRNNAKNPNLYVELGGYLFEKGKTSEATAVFKRAMSLPLSSKLLHLVRHWSRDENGEKKIFRGIIQRMAGAGAFVLAIPENFEAYFFRGTGETACLVQGDKIAFSLGFSCRGPRAHVIRILESAISKVPPAKGSS